MGKEALEPRKIHESRHESSRQMMPADANPSQSVVYGGSILKYIDEVAAVSAIRHARTKCVTASIERMDFLEPVLVGDLLHIKAAIIFTGRTSMIVGVRVEAENLMSGKTTKTGSCYMTFVALDNRDKPAAVAPVVPSNEEETRWHIRGRKLYELRKALLAADKIGIP